MNEFQVALPRYPFIGALVSLFVITNHVCYIFFQDYFDYYLTSAF
jgi:hypothetical protein